MISFVFYGFAGLLILFGLTMLIKPEVFERDGGPQEEPHEERRTRLVFFLGSLFLAACSVITGYQHFSDRLEGKIDGSLTVKSDLRLAVSGETGLPDGALVSVVASNAERDFEFKDYAEVRKNKFKINEYGPAGGFPPGLYKVQMTFQITSAQPKSLLDKFGENGERLSGEGVTTLDDGKKIIAAYGEIMIGTKEAAVAIDQGILKQREEFSSQRAGVLATLRKALQANDYQQVLDLADSYRGIKDPEVGKLRAEAQSKLDEMKQKKEAARLAKEERKKLISRHFSAWDGSHAGLERLIKASMNDPDSYKHVETVYWDMGDHLVVRTTYRGKNVYGGVVKNAVKAKVDLNGNVMKVMDQW